MAAKKEEGKTILNKTRSSKERWTYYSKTKELVNGKERFPLSEFAIGEHPMVDQVLQWMEDAGLVGEVAPIIEARIDEVNAKIVENEKEIDVLVSETIEAQSKIEKSFAEMPKQMKNIQSDLKGLPEEQQLEYSRLMLRSITEHEGKGAARKMRKALHAAGYHKCAAVPLASKDMRLAA